MEFWRVCTLNVCGYSAFSIPCPATFADPQDIEDVRGLLSDTNLTMLGLTYLIILLHICFDYLAFKNDIGFWRGRKVGGLLSTDLILCLADKQKHVP